MVLIHASVIEETRVLLQQKNEPDEENVETLEEENAFDTQIINKDNLHLEGLTLMEKEKDLI